MNTARWIRSGVAIALALAGCRSNHSGTAEVPPAVATELPVASAGSGWATNGPRVGELLVARTEGATLHATVKSKPLTLEPEEGGVPATTPPLPVLAVDHGRVRVRVTRGSIELWLWLDQTSVPPVVTRPTSISLVDGAAAAWGNTGLWASPGTALRVHTDADTRPQADAYARVSFPPLEMDRFHRLSFTGFVPSTALGLSFTESDETVGPVRRPRWTDGTPTDWIHQRSELRETPGGIVLAILEAKGGDMVPLFERRDGHVLVSLRDHGIEAVGWVARNAFEGTVPEAYGYGSAYADMLHVEALAGTCVFDGDGNEIGQLIDDEPVDTDVLDVETPWGYLSAHVRPEGRSRDSWARCKGPIPDNASAVEDQRR